MPNNQLFTPKAFYIFHLLFVFCIYLGYGQEKEASLMDQFSSIKNSSKEYEDKFKEINLLITTKKNLVDSIQLSLLYTDFSKLNYRNKDYPNAILNVKKAIEIQNIFKDSVPQLLNRSYNNLAYFYNRSEDKTNEFQTFKTLIEQSYKDKYTIKAYTIGLANIFIERGDYYKLLDYLREAELIILKENDSLLNKELYSVYLSFSRVYYKTGDPKNYQKAIEYLQKTEETIVDFTEEEKVKHQIVVYNRYGNIYDELNAYDKAIFYYQKALDLSLAKESVDDYRIAIIYNNLGYIHARINQHEKAYSYYQKALDHDPYQALSFDNLGDYFLFKKDYPKSIKHYQKAINYSLGNFNDTDTGKPISLEDLIRSDNKIELVNDFKDKANALLLYYESNTQKIYLEQALEAITNADRLIDQIRSNSFEQRSKFFWRKKGVDLYMLAVSICYKLKLQKKAFYFMEKSKSLSLLENLTHEEAKKRGGLPEAIQEREYALKYEILMAAQKAENDSSLSEVDRQSLIFKSKRNYEKFIESLEKEYPNYHKYKKEISLVSFNESLEKMKIGNSALVQYILSKDEGYGMYISPNSTKFFKIDEVEDLNKDIGQLGKFLNKPIFSKDDHTTYQSLSFKISKKILPFLYETEDVNVEKLIVIPDHLLQYLPFETLVLDNTVAGTEKSYLINHKEISYLYSMSLSKSTEQTSHVSNGKFIGFAPVDFDNHQLAKLERSLQKMDIVKELFDGTVLIKNEASKERFIKESAHYKAIHLSTHASSVNNKEPWIAFYDKKLSLKELYFINNQADLVILDACKTGIGELQPGEGIMSITRGFFHSGAKSVISSLWNTNEKSSNEIILKFYRYLGEGKSKSFALRKAKLDYLNDHYGSEISPYFWAPLILNGNTKTITLSKNESQTTTWVLLLVLSVVLGLLFFYLKSKRA